MPYKKKAQSIDVRPVEGINLIANDYVSMAELQRNLRDNKVLTPLEFLVAVYSSDEVDVKSRIEAAKTASRFIHKPQPVAIEHSGKDGKDIKLIDLQEAAKAKLLDYLDDNTFDAELIEAELKEAETVE